MAPKGYALTEAEARDFNRMRAERRRLGPPKARRQPRRRRHGGGGPSRTGDPAYGSPWTIIEYDAVSGEKVRIYDRGRGRFGGGSGTFDAHIILSADELYLYALGGASVQPDPEDDARLVKWNINTGERLWYSDQGAFEPPSPTINAGTNRCDQCTIEASDGFIWCCSGPGASNNGFVSRHNPDTGVQTHSFGAVTNFGFQLLPCPTAGSVIVANSSAAGGKYIRILDATATETHSYSTSFTSIEEHAGRLYVLASASLVILNASDLTTIDSRAGTGGADTYLCLTTDGTTVWVATTTGANSKYRAYDAANLATENWNAARDTASADTFRLIYDGTALYDFSQIDRRINATTGAEEWQSDTTLAQLNRRTGAAIGTDFTFSAHSASSHLYCRNKSDGAVRWTDVNTNPQSVAVTSDDRCFLCCQRTGPN